MTDPTTLLALTITAILSGFIDAIAGGGGLVVVPALLFAGVPPINALATNKLQSSFGTSVAAWTYGRKGLIQIRPHLATLAAIFAGATAGVLVVQRIRSDSLKLLIPLLLVGLAFYVLLSPRMVDADAQERIGQPAYVPLGGAIGFYDGFFGPGAGSFYAASLVALRGFGLTRATATTKLYNITSNLASLLLFAFTGRIWWTLGLCMAGGAMIGNYLGSRLAIRLGARVIRPLLVVISLALTARLLWGYFFA